MDIFKTLHRLKNAAVVLAIIGILLAILVPALRRSTTIERLDACCSLCGARTVRVVEKGIASVAPPQMLESLTPFEHQHIWVADGKVTRESFFGSEAYDAHGPRLFVAMLELQTFLELVGGKKDDPRLQDFYLRLISKIPESSPPAVIEQLRQRLISHEQFRGLKGMSSETAFWDSLKVIDTAIISSTTAQPGAF